MRKQHAAPVVEDYDSFEPVNAPTLRLKQVLLARGPPPELVELRRFSMPTARWISVDDQSNAHIISISCCCLH